MMEEEDKKLVRMFTQSSIKGNEQQEQTEPTKQN